MKPMRERFWALVDVRGTDDCFWATSHRPELREYLAFVSEQVAA